MQPKHHLLPKKSRILREAKELIEQGEYQFICNAIEHVARNRSREGHPLWNAWNKESFYLTEWISGLLQEVKNDEGKKYSYAQWLMKYHPETWGKEANLCRIQEGRRAWLDWMINYWEKKGD